MAEVDSPSPECMFGSESPPQSRKTSSLDPLCGKRLVLIRYLDHVLYHRTSALAMKPQIREAVGWLIHECDSYIIIAWDQDAEPPTLHDGDPKASGLVLLKSDVLTLKRLSVESAVSHEGLGCAFNAKGPQLEASMRFPPRKRKTQRENSGRRNKQ